MEFYKLAPAGKNTKDTAFIRFKKVLTLGGGGFILNELLGGHMVAINMKSTVGRARSELKNIQKQVDFATANTINTIAFVSKSEIDRQIKARLNRPTRFAQRAVEVVKGNRRTLTSTVRVQTRHGQSETFGHLFTGGKREGKGYEGVLKRMGVLPGGMYTVPGKAAPINSFGNIRKAFIDKMIKELSGGNIPAESVSTLPPGIWRRLPERGRKSKRTGHRIKRRKAGLFVVHKQSTGSGRKSKQPGRPPEAVMLFVERPRYRRYFDLPDTVRDVIRKRFDAEFDKNFKRAIATARR